jgi:hypothetical protein
MAERTISQTSGTYHSFSGVDIRAVFGEKIIGELQAISYMITREKAPIYTMGSPDPRAFNRGKRGIAGSLIFIVFDRAALLETMGTESRKYLADKDEPKINRNLEFFSTSTYQSLNVEDPQNPNTPTGLQAESQRLSDQHEARQAMYVDQIPPFDVTLTAANEYGQLAVMRILGVEILNEGSGVSIDDIVTEQNMTYVARAVIPWRPAGNMLTGER